MAVALVDSVVFIDYKDTGAGDRHDRLAASAGFELDHSAQKDYQRAVELFETDDWLRVR